METTKQQTFTLPVIEAPLIPLREFVSDFGEDELDAAAEPQARGEVRATLRERSSGSDQITAVHTDDGHRESYTFNVTDHDRGLCAYTRHGDGEVAPPHIRRVLIDFGYHDTTGPPESPLWFPEYARAILPMLTGCVDTADSELVRGLLTSYLTMVDGSLRAAYTVSRFESPQDVPDELAEEVFQQGTESPLFGAESWSDVDQSTLQMEVSVAEWDFDQSFLPQPPKGDTEGWESYLYADKDGQDPKEAEQRLANALASSPLFPYITDPSDVTSGEKSALSPEEGSTIQVEAPDSPEPGDYIRVSQYGPVGVTQHEFRITTPTGADQRGTCVFENRDPNAALPPYAAIHAVSTTGYSIENAPSFRVDATPAEVVKNTYDVLRAIYQSPPVSEVVGVQLDMVSRPLIVLWYGLTAVDVAGPKSVDAVATAFTQEAAGESLSTVMDEMGAQTDRLIVEFLRDNHPKADEIEAAYNDSWLPDHLHLDHTDLFADLPDS